MEHSVFPILGRHEATDWLREIQHFHYFTSFKTCWVSNLASLLGLEQEGVATEVMAATVSFTLHSKQNKKQVVQAVLATEVLQKVLQKYKQTLSHKYPVNMKWFKFFGVFASQWQDWQYEKYPDLSLSYVFHVWTSFGPSLLCCVASWRLDFLVWTSVWHILSCGYLAVCCNIQKSSWAVYGN